MVLRKPGESSHGGWRFSLGVFQHQLHLASIYAAGGTGDVAVRNHFDLRGKIRDFLGGTGIIPTSAGINNKAATIKTGHPDSQMTVAEEFLSVACFNGASRCPKVMPPRCCANGIIASSAGKTMMASVRASGRWPAISGPTAAMPVRCSKRRASFGAAPSKL